MRRMLDPKEAGGSLPSTVKFDQEGNRTVGKDLGVDGKLKLKSLVSASNPDGDITKELGGGGGGGSIQLYRHHIYLYYKDDFNNTGYIFFDYDSTNAEKFTIDTLITAMKGKTFICSGYIIITLKRIVVSITGIDDELQIKNYYIEGTTPEAPTRYSLSKNKLTIKEEQVYRIN